MGARQRSRSALGRPVTVLIVDGLRLTHVGGPTVLIELAGWRLLSDPTFDPPGGTYGFGLGTASTKTAGPALDPAALGHIDAVLLSHDHHADNLDDRGRALLPSAGTVITTQAGRRRLGGSHVRGLRPGASTVLTASDRPPLSVLATPCRHGPPLSRPVAGAVIGFALRISGSSRTALWMTGDTVLHRPLRRTAASLHVDVLLLHLGSVQFPISGPLRYSMNGADAIDLIGLAQPRVAVPVHYEGWSHFREPEAHLRSSLAGAPGEVRQVVRWLRRGEATEV